MIECWMVWLVLMVILMLGSFLVFVVEGGIKLLQVGNDFGDCVLLQWGVQLYMNYCFGCYVLKYLCYLWMVQDLGLIEEEVMNNFNFIGLVIGDLILVVMFKENVEKWFGKMLFDFSLIVCVCGSDWVYIYFKLFYLDSSCLLGWNNVLFVNVFMFNLLWEMQGLQYVVYGKVEVFGMDLLVIGLKIEMLGLVDVGQYDQVVWDIINFFEYVGELVVFKCQQLGVWVILFLVLLIFLLYLLKKEYWKDVY